jgi:hypothetical protein
MSCRNRPRVSTGSPGSAGRATPTPSARGWSGSSGGWRRSPGAFFAPLEAETEAPEIGEEAAAIVARWPGYPALRSTRGQEIFERLKPGFLASFDKAAKPLEALQNFDGFLRGLPAGVQLFSMFEANPPLVDLIVDISATAPRLSRYLSRHSVVLDAVLDGRFFAPWPGRDALDGGAARALRGAGLRAEPRQRAALAARMAFPHRRASVARPDHARHGGAALHRPRRCRGHRALAAGLRRGRGGHGPAPGGAAR